MSVVMNSWVVLDGIAAALDAGNVAKEVTVIVEIELKIWVTVVLP